MNNAILFAVIGLVVLMTSSLLLNISGRGGSPGQLFIYFFQECIRESCDSILFLSILSLPPLPFQSHKIHTHLGFFCDVSSLGIIPTRHLNPGYASAVPEEGLSRSVASV